MSRLFRTSSWMCVAAALAATAPAHAGPRDFVAYATRLGGDSDVAQPYIARFVSYVESALAWPAGSAQGKFFSNRKDAQAFMEGQKPGFGLVEPALYLELRKTYGLEPLLQVDSPDLSTQRLNLVVKDPALTSLDALKGKRLFTQLADFPRYLSKIVFAGRVDAATHFTLKSTRQAMRGVHAVLRGEADATLLDEAQLAEARKLEGGAALRSIYESRPLPPLALVAFASNIKPEDRKALTRALQDMCGKAKGEEVCKEMRINRFIPVNASLFLEAQKGYDQP